MIDPARAVPSVIDHMMVTPVKVHAQPAPDRQAITKGDEWPRLDIYNRSVILRDVYILRSSWNDLDIVSIDNDGLFSVADKIPEGPRAPSEPLDSIGHVFRLIEKGISQVSSPIHITCHHLQNSWIVGNCPDRFSPTLLINILYIASAVEPRIRIGHL
jgi:hypothetical protein